MAKKGRKHLVSESLDIAFLQVLHGLITATMPEHKLESLAPKGATEQLMAKADAKGRYGRCDDLPDTFAIDGVALLGAVQIDDVQKGGSLADPMTRHGGGIAWRRGRRACTMLATCAMPSMRPRAGAGGAGRAPARHLAGG